MAKKTNQGMMQIEEMDLSDILSVNEEIVSVTERNDIEQKGDLIKFPKLVKQKISSQNRKKRSINFNSEAKEVKKFKKLAMRKLASSNLDVRPTMSLVAASVLHAMKAAHKGKLMEPTELDLAFYQKRDSRTSGSMDIDIIHKKEPFLVSMDAEDVDLAYKLMHNFYINLKVKPPRYSLPYFFFEIVRFFENNYKEIEIISYE